MKKFWNTYKRVIILLCFWRMLLFCIELVAPFVVPLHTGYNGPIPWANHDGIHYLMIAERGYFQYSEAFFPLYPLLIYVFSLVLPIAPWFIGCLISLISFVIGIFVLYTFLSTENKEMAWWTILFIVAFPTSFFFSAVYSTGIFFLLTVLTFVFARKRHWWWCGIFGALASATRIFGVFLFFYVVAEYWSTKPKKIIWKDIVALCLIPVGLLVYMIFLFVQKGDPLLFFHIQPLFGANRSGSTLILLPQVLWRYAKIIFTAFLQPTPVSYAISIIELGMTLLGYGVLWIGYKTKERFSYLLYGVLALTLPTLTGTLSSMPRYLLNVLPLFIILGKLPYEKAKYVLIMLSVFFQIILTALFLRGWFVA